MKYIFYCMLLACQCMAAAAATAAARCWQERQNWVLRVCFV
jgi:hypothetical protein